MSTPVIEARAATYRTREGAALVQGVDLALRPGRLLTLVGPNGAGKSTLLRLLSGELRPSAGEVLLDGAPVSRMPPHRLAARRAVLAQSTGLSLPFRVAEVVRLGAEGVGRGLDARQRERIVVRAMERAGVAGHASRLVGTLSGGERQRVHFARVLAQLEAGASVARRQALLLDEPVAALDLRHQIALLAEARRIAEDGATVLAILHDLQLAATFADEVVLLDRGRVAGAGAAGDVLTRGRILSVFGVDLRTSSLPPMPWGMGEPVLGAMTDAAHSADLGEDGKTRDEPRRPTRGTRADAVNTKTAPGGRSPEEQPGPQARRDPTRPIRHHGRVLRHEPLRGGGGEGREPAIGALGTDPLDP